ncbi:MAG: DUF362 domain-containing protein [Planctomycetes bacterium]|nr:DUF362 domain-containing protein [Planctomycetota bacterium]
MSRVFVDRFGLTKPLDVAVAEAFEWVHSRKIITPTSRVFVKPNLTWRKPTPGVTVTPAFLRAIVHALSALTPFVTIGESEGGQACFQAEEAFESHGLYDLEREYGIRVVNLSHDQHEVVTTTIAGKLVSVELPRLLLHEVDVFVTLPVPKIHALTVASLGFKNQWGCLGDKNRVTQHPQFDHMILAINKILQPKLCIFDGSYFLDYTGPMMGEAVPMNLIIAGDDVGAASLACCEIMRLDPMSVPHHRLALREGMFPASIESVELNCQPSIFAQRKFRLKRAAINYIHLAAFKNRILNRFFYNSLFADAVHEILWLIRRNSYVKRLLYGKYGSGTANRGGRET